MSVPPGMRPRTAQLVHHLPVRQPREALTRERGAQSIAEQPFQCFPVVGRDTLRRVQREPGHGGAERLAPQGTAAFPTSGPAPLVVSFTAEATGGTAPYTFLWSFGDGGSDQAQNPVHTFTAAGTYEVHMMVWDAESRTCQGAVSIEVQ